MSAQQPTDVEASAQQPATSWAPLEPGLWDDVPEDRYHADPALSSTTLRALLPPSTPKQARYDRDHPRHSDAFDLGTVVHTWVLHDGLAPVEVDAKDWRTKAAQEARDAARAEGRPALLTKDMARARRMVEAIRAHPLAGSLLEPGTFLPERTVVWDDPGTGVRCRARIDAWGLPAAWGQVLPVDVKTTHNADPGALPRTVEERGYHVQDWLYREGVASVTGEMPPFMFVFVDKDPPHDVVVAEVHPDYQAIAHDRVRRALQVWADCTASGEWPGHPVDVHTITPPRWART